jgi:iron(III) transport system substrate-binding protein
VRRRTFAKGAAATAGALAMPAGPLIRVAGAAPAAQSGQLNLYSSRHYDTDARLFSGFTEQTGVRVNVIEGTEDQLITRIQTEGANSPADLLITVDAGRLWRAEQAGLFQPVFSDVLTSRVPEHLRHPEGFWYGLAKRVRVLAYARNRVSPAELSTYEALAQGKWRRRLLVRSSAHVYNQSLVGSLIEANGLDATQAWAREIVANMARRPQGGDTDQINAVAAGVGDVAITNHYYYARLANSSLAQDQDVVSKVGLFFPSQAESERGAHVNISGAGVIATAPNRDNAVAFMEYLLGDAAQSMFARGSNEFPVVDGVELDPVLAGWGPYREDRLNAATFGYNGRGAQFLMDRAGWR